MSKLALYQKYRSTTFDEVVGQETTVRTIQNAIRENKVGHAYLFCGPRGTGKTTMARLLAKAVNCEHPEKAPCGECDSCRMAAAGTHPDIIEINAANETHVEDVRDLIERAKLAPMMGRHKIYIIDEVHQLSSAAASALLKTLEEPPENVIFILATTDPQKLLPTIVSRCQRFNFYRIRTDQIQEHLLDIAKKENIDMEEAAAYKIAVLANGGMRDALSIMDECASFAGNHITEADIDKIYGLTSKREQMDLLLDVFHKNIPGVLKRVEAYEHQGINIGRMTDSLIDILKDVTVFQYTQDSSLLRVLTPEEMTDLAQAESPSELLRMIDILMEGKNKFKLAESESSAFEVVMLECIVSRETIQPAPQTEAKSYTSPKTSARIQPVQNQPELKPLSPPETPEEKHPEEEPSGDSTIRRLTEDDVLGMMLISDKKSKAEDQKKLKKKDEIVDLDAMKYKKMLKNAGIALSGRDLIVFCLNNKASAERINAAGENKELYVFLRDSLGIDKNPYAVTKDFFMSCVNAFRTRSKDGTLPAPFKVEKYVEEKKETAEEKTLKLFGSENVEIIGEENDGHSAADGSGTENAADPE